MAANLAENRTILTDLYALSSCFYIKGIVDANRVYDPFLIESIYKRENINDLTILMGFNPVVLKEKDYIKIVVATASSHGLYSIRNWLLKVASNKIQKSVCFLMDFLYRYGMRRQAVYDGSQSNKMLSEVTTYMTRYNTPEGLKHQSAWHDLIRQYILQIRIESGVEEMDCLDEFMAVTLKNETQLQEAAKINEKRRKYILSGGRVLREPGKNKNHK